MVGGWGGGVWVCGGLWGGGDGRKVVCGSQGVVGWWVVGWWVVRVGVGGGGSGVWWWAGRVVGVGWK